MLSNTLKNNRDRSTNLNYEKTIRDLVKEYSLQKCLKIIPLLKVENIKVNELEKFLRKFFDENQNPLDKNDDNKKFRSDLKRVIKIYDWLKYR